MEKRNLNEIFVCTIAGATNKMMSNDEEEIQDVTYGFWVSYGYNLIREKEKETQNGN